VIEDQLPEIAEMQPELLAHHYTEAGMNEQAIGYWQRAGERASERSAHQEAMSHLTTGLDLLQSLPETLERHRLELPLQMALGTASMIIKGHAAPEVVAAYMRARVICRHLGDTQDVLPVLFGLWRFYVVRPDFPLAHQVAEELLSLAEQRNETPLYVVAHYAMGCTCIWIEKLHLAHSHLEKAIAHYHPSQRSDPMFRVGQDPGVAQHAK